MENYKLESGKVTIICYHHVCTEEELARKIVSVPDCEISDKDFAKELDFLSNKGANFVSLEQVLSGDIASDSPSVLVTFDDGFRSYLDLAMPIMEARNIPSCMYITTGYQDDEIVHIAGILHEKILNENTISLMIDGEEYTFTTRTRQEKVDAYLSLIDSLDRGGVKCLTELRKVLDENNLLNESRFGFTLTWQEVRELSKHPLVTIGAHSVNHPNLTKLSDENVLHEINHSIARLNDNGVKTKHFSYPYGEYDDRIVELCKKLELDSVVTTEPDVDWEILSLPRFVSAGDVTEVFT